MSHSQPLNILVTCYAVGHLYNQQRMPHTAQGISADQKPDSSSAMRFSWTCAVLYEVISWNGLTDVTHSI